MRKDDDDDDDDEEDDAEASMFVLRCERVLVDVVCVYARMHSVHLGASQRKCRKICSQTASRSSLVPQTLNVQESTFSSTRNSGLQL